MTAIAPENTELASAVEAYAKQDAAEWLALMAEHSAGITPMYQRIDVNEGEDDGADARASQRKRKRAAALTDETAPSEGVRASITPPLIDVLRIVQQANLVRTGARPSRANNGVNVATVNEHLPRARAPEGRAADSAHASAAAAKTCVKDCRPWLTAASKTDDPALAYCLREYAIHVARDNAAFGTYMHTYVQGWSLFQCAALRAMDAARGKAHELLPIKGDARRAIKSLCKAATDAARALNDLHARARPVLLLMPSQYHDAYVAAADRVMKGLSTHPAVNRATFASVMCYCQVCGQVKNLAGAYYGMNKQTSHSVRFHSLRLRVPAEDTVRELYFCAKHQRAWMRTASTGELRMTVENVLSYINMTSALTTRITPLNASRTLAIRE
ncbi:hypothetical protein CYMTET_19394 [Cymbomonas tetramitiformis]|uniref:Uncharacterized protein n=1 Tax=Cymbomonas tetramitiformis TaxID=36881 RepID=A0AAE0G6P1_9CHLO|nr:hypothetical protein CYMTET_19394 [Cymbomonas tetramitiformis]